MGRCSPKQDAETQARLQQAAAALEDLPDDRPEDIRAKELAFRRHEETEEYRHKKHLADAWCAAFVIRKHFREPRREASASGITQGHLNDLADGRPLPAELDAEVQRLSRQYQFFHWHLAFPDVFRLPGSGEKPENEQTGWSGGFDVVLGNPPWERVQVEEKQFFAGRRPEIAQARTRDRTKLLENLQTDDEALFRVWQEARREGLAQTHLIKDSMLFPLSGIGNVNTYATFVESGFLRTGSRDRLGMIVPSGLVTESTFRAMFKDWVDRNRLVSVRDFENRNKLFPSVHSSFRFCLLTLTGSSGGAANPMTFAFALHSVHEALDVDRVMHFTAANLRTINPESRTVPPAPSRRDAEILLRLHCRFHVFMPSLDSSQNPWKSDSKQMVNVSHDSDDFVEPSESVVASMNDLGVSTRDQSNLRLYDGKMIDQFDHRFASVGYRKDTTFRTSESTQTSAEHHQIPDHLVWPQYWIPESRVVAVLPDYCRQRHWLIAYREVTASTNWRTIIASVVPYVGLLHTAPTIYSPLTATLQACLVGNLNSFALDFAARLKISGTHLSHFLLRQLPVLPPTAYSEKCRWTGDPQSEFSIIQFLVPRVLELTYTAWDLEPFAQACNYPGPPFCWDEKRRFLLRAELDAAFFHLYAAAEPNGTWRPYVNETTEDLSRLESSFATPRDAVSYIMDTFPIVRRKDEAKYNGDYRTKRVILEIYDAMQQAIRTGRPYHTLHDPPPGPPTEPLPEWPAGAPRPANWPMHIHPPRQPRR